MILMNFKRIMRQHMGVPQELDTGRCIACRHPQTYSQAGEREHAKTGVCEGCWDLLVAGDMTVRAQAVNRCNRLAGANACAYVADWIGVNRTAPGGTLRCIEPQARHIIAIGTEQMAPPNLWQQGERP